VLDYRYYHLKKKPLFWNRRIGLDIQGLSGDTRWETEANPGVKTTVGKKKAMPQIERR
jgi:hypothetical protein